MVHMNDALRMVHYERCMVHCDWCMVQYEWCMTSVTHRRDGTTSVTQGIMGASSAYSRSYKDQKLKEVGDLVIELARSFGSCVYCPLNQCNKIRNNVCRFETNWEDAVTQVVRSSKRTRAPENTSGQNTTRF